MDYESFKEKFVEDLKDRLDEQGADVKVSVNTVQVAPADKLTDSVYHYDSQAKIFELGGKFVQRQAEREVCV